MYHRSEYDMASEKTKALVENTLTRIEERLKLTINTANNRINVSEYFFLNLILEIVFDWCAVTSE